MLAGTPSAVASAPRIVWICPSTVSKESSAWEKAVLAWSTSAIVATPAWCRASAAERLKSLRQCASLLGLTMPALIDSDDNVVNRAYAAWPDRLYVVDLDGKIAYKAGQGPAGFKPAEVEAWLKENVK